MSDDLLLPSLDDYLPAKRSRQRESVTDSTTIVEMKQRVAKIDRTIATLKRERDQLCHVIWEAWEKRQISGT